MDTTEAAERRRLEGDAQDAADLGVNAADSLEPPYDLVSDMMFAVALCPTRAMRRAFPGVPFLSLFGKTPLVLWFSRITEACSNDEKGERICMREQQGLYNELNAMAPLQDRAIFVPGIYATSELSIRIGHRYGMPKQPARMLVEEDGNRFTSKTMHGRRRSYVRARLIGGGKLIGKIVSLLWPMWTWPARFPDGGEVRALIEETPAIQLAFVRSGRLSLEADWLPRSSYLLPVGVYAPELRMQLPPP